MNRCKCTDGVDIIYEISGSKNQCPKPTEIAELFLQKCARKKNSGAFKTLFVAAPYNIILHTCKRSSPHSPSPQITRVQRRPYSKSCRRRRGSNLVLMSGHVIRLLIDSGRGLSNGCVRLLH